MKIRKIILSNIFYRLHVSWTQIPAAISFRPTFTSLKHSIDGNKKVLNGHLHSARNGASVFSVDELSFIVNPLFSFASSVTLSSSLTHCLSFPHSVEDRRSPRPPSFSLSYSTVSLTANDIDSESFSISRARGGCNQLSVSFEVSRISSPHFPNRAGRNVGIHCRCIPVCGTSAAPRD
jgi:hypothetical protein